MVLNGAIFVIMNRMETSFFGFIFSELGRALAWFPAWWYTVGLMFVFERLTTSVRSMSRFAGFDTWSKNLFVPMYGDTSASGKAISFMIRFFMTASLGLAVLAWAVLMIALGILYLFLLPLSVFGALSQIVLLFFS